MRSTFYKLAAVALGAVVGPGCTDNGGETEDGSPYATHIVTGTVYADFDQQPIEGIELRIATGTSPALTGSDGTFELNQTASPCRPTCEVTASDPDGTANRGEFASQTLDVTMEQTAQPTDAWGDGTWEAHGLVIVMDRISGGGGSAAGGTGGQGGSGATGGSGGASSGGSGGAGGGA